MDLAESLDRLSTKLDNLKHDELLVLLDSLERIVDKTRDILHSSSSSLPPSHLPLPSTHHPPSSSVSPLPSSPLSSPSSPPASDEFQHLFRYSPQALDASLMDRVHEHLKGLTYHPNTSSPNSPEIYLYGKEPYVYNKQSSQLSPKPTITSLPMAELLIAVNKTLNTNYNSMLINKYRNIHCKLGPHKDDEKNLDPTSPISALSLGATRRFHVSSNANKDKVIHTVHLESRSLCTMLPGFQNSYHHSIAAGRKSIRKEKGERYSVTFRRILPDAVEKEEENPTVLLQKQVPHTDNNTPDTLVFGSSLTKDLDDTLLSKYKKKFRVFSNSGAKVRDIVDDVKCVKDDEALDIRNVSSVFLVCGGNDIENLQKDADIEDVHRDYENLVALAKDMFPAAKINIVSLIPRRARYRAHIDNMHEMNEWLDDFCHEHSFRFVDIFSHYVLKLPHIWLLNNKLFNKGHLHFNEVGNSVIAKVLMGVANFPR